MQLRVNTEKKTILVNNEEYYAMSKGGPWYPDDPAEAPKGNKLWYGMGLRNIFLFNDDSEYGIKLFGKSIFLNRRVKSLIFRNDDLEKFKWQQLSKKQVEKLAHFHQELANRNLSPKCKNRVLSFNNGRFYGLEIEYVKGEPFKYKDNEKRYNEFEEKLWKVFPKVGMTRRQMDIRPDNIRFCEKRNSMLYIDIEYGHLIDVGL